MFIVGLGNPGQNYAKHRHNIGFMAVDALQQASNAPAFAKAPIKHDGGALITTASNHGEIARLIKPLSYMNLSGGIVQRCLAYYKHDPKTMLVIHDDLDVPFGRLRVKFGGGAGGHNGLRSIDQLVGKDYWRLRIGIGHPGHKDLVSDYVLSNFTSKEQATLSNMLEAITKTLCDLIAQDQKDWKQFQTDITAINGNT